MIPPMRSASRRGVSAPLLALAVVSGAAAMTGAQPMEKAGFDLQGHRGARGLAPENTLAGFAKALSLGVSTLELDCAVTRDGIPVVSHDSQLNPDHTRDAEGRFLEATGPSLSSLTYAELASAMPEAGGEHAYSLRALGWSGSFFCTWSLVLGYASIVMFEAVALPTALEYLFPQVRAG